ncbi:MAG TPA: integration host factor subunit alpha [Methylocella sp.]|nr:integration host factor subunit alpha [Methylocella sp.]
MTRRETTLFHWELGLVAADNPETVNGPSTRTITRVDLAEAVYRSVGLSRKESALLVQAVLDEVAEALTAGDCVKLSSFGRFVVRNKPERLGRNPKTGVPVPITERRVLSFKPSAVLKARINGQVVPDEED